MPSSSQNSKSAQSLALKQAASWQCRACGRQCRRHNELIADFAARVGHDVNDIQAHPRRWMLHTTALSTKPCPESQTVLCGSCHRAHHNYQRRQRQQRQHYQQQEQIGQLTLRDIRLPLAGVQLSLHDWGTPYEIVNPQPRRKQTRASSLSKDT